MSSIHNIIQDNIRADLVFRDGFYKNQVDHLPAMQTGRQPYLFTKPPTIGPVMKRLYQKGPQ